jgi:hypothetical protein
MTHSKNGWAAIGCIFSNKCGILYWINMIYLNDYVQRVENADYLDISEFFVVVAQYSLLIFIVCPTVVLLAFTPKVIGKFGVMCWCSPLG